MTNRYVRFEIGLINKLRPLNNEDTFTGSNGLLGQKIAVATANYPQHSFLATSRGANRTKAMGTATYASMDITNAEDVSNVVGDFEPDVIIHGAAMTRGRM